MNALPCDQLLASPLMQQVIRVESGGNPYAIGVVGGRLERQPRNLAEAVATAQSLEEQGRNFSIGTGQVNRIHFRRLGWSSAIERGFDTCENARAALGVLQACYDKAVSSGYPVVPSPGGYGAVHAALSCYYSGDLVAGARLGYVTKVLGPKAAVAPLSTKKSKSAPSMLIE